MKEIPIVDFANISTKNGRVPSKANWTTTAAEIDKALSTIGFAYLINHDIDQQKISKAFATGKSFFELPQKVKEKYLKDASKTYHGYAKPGQELLHPNSTYEMRESFDFAGDRRFYPNKDVPDFEFANIELENECKPLIKKLLRIFAISLEIEDEEFFINSSKYIDDQTIPTYSGFRSIYYPAVSDDVPAGTVRCAEHSDYGTLTILFQDDIGGLEVKTVDNNWVAAMPIPDSLLINTGDLLEFWSNGHFPATNHRVFIPEQEIKRKVARQSIVYFHHPDYSTAVTPLMTQNSINVDKNDYAPITAGEHAKKRLESTYQY